MTTTGYLVIEPDGTTDVVPDRGHSTPGRLQYLAEGFLEIVELQPGLDMVIHEHRAFSDEENPVATHVLETFHGPGSEVIFGVVVLTGVHDDRTVPLDGEMLDRLQLVTTRADRSRPTPEPLDWTAYRATAPADRSQYKCPKCDGYIPDNDNPGAYPGALSRRDNKTEVCSACGTREALEDLIASRGEA